MRLMIVFDEIVFNDLLDVFAVVDPFNDCV